MANKKVNLTEFLHGQTADNDGMGALFYPPRDIIADDSLESTDRMVFVSVLGAVGSPRTVTIPTALVTKSGFTCWIKDVTGNASVEQPILIVTASSQNIDGNTDGAVFITSPYGSVQLVSDGTQMWTMPWLQATDHTLEGHRYVDQDASGTQPEVPLLTLPQGTGSSNTISLFMTSANMVPYIQADQGGSTATMTFSHRFFNGTNQIFTVPDTDTVTITNPTKYYFTGDGLIDTNQSYLVAKSTGQLRINVLGDAADSTPRQQVTVDFDSRGQSGGSFPLVSCAIRYRNAQFLELD